MDANEIVRLCKKHTMYSWTAGDLIDPLPVSRAEGVYVWTADGKRLLDFASQAFSVNIGHSHPKVKAVMKEAVDEVLFASASSATEARARFGQLLSEIFPGDLNSFFFTLGGADANENALKMVRQYTGRYKVIGRYRSYHGGTHATTALAGDPRRRHVRPLPGFVHILDIEPQKFQFGDSDSVKVKQYLDYVEEVLLTEGPDQVAAMFVEALPGTNGAIVPPAGYLQQLHALLKKHGVLLVCDEVLTGLGRTGKMFAFEHHGIVPDLVTTAKGLSSSYVPLGCVAVSDPIAEYFKKNVFWGGLTYNAHPFLLRVARATLEVLLEEGMVENAAAMGEVLAERFAAIQDKHPCVVDTRSQGLFGVIEVSPELAPSPLLSPDTSNNKVTKELKARLRDRGVYAIMRYNNLFACPPLSIGREALGEALDIIDEELTVLDNAM